MSGPRRVLITGATGGLGAALAMAYAAPGTQLILTGRNTSRLAEIGERCEQADAQTEIHSLDIVDIDALRSWSAEVANRDKLDLVFINAGITSNIGTDGSGEDWDTIEQVIAANLTAALATAHAVLPGMRKHGEGQIVFISSLSAYFGLPLTPAYCASKAALKAYAEAWRGWLAPEGIGVTAVFPGFVDSDMSRRFPGPRPFLMTPESAAAIIKKRLRRNPARISFPFPLSLGMWWLGVLPPGASLRILKLLGYSP